MASRCPATLSHQARSILTASSPAQAAVAESAYAAGRLRRPRPRAPPLVGLPAGTRASPVGLAKAEQTRACSSQSSGVGLVQLSKARHEALIQAEIVHFATALSPHPITLQQILAHRDAETLRAFLLVELPIRYSRRLALIESLEGYENFQHMRVIRSIYSDAFRRLRMLTQEDAEPFRKTVANIKHRHSNMLMHVIRGTQAMKAAKSIPDEFVNKFLDDFLTARIGTDILCSQYLALTRPGGATSVIDPQCDPVALSRAAAADAVRLCKYHYGYAPPVEVVDVGQVRFPFIPQYLNYIMFEIIKNSLRAVTERYDSSELANYPVRVTVCGDDDTVVIRTTDAGGGIPLDVLPSVWSYLYTTARPVGEDDATQSESEESEEDEESVSPMAGFGCGLPLSRTYSSYVGGRLELTSMPHHGCSAYLYLNRLGDSEEVMDCVVADLPFRSNLTVRAPPDQRSE